MATAETLPNFGLQLAKAPMATRCKTANRYITLAPECGRRSAVRVGFARGAAAADT